MLQIKSVISDRGSKYAVSGGAAGNRDEADAFLRQLKRDKKFARATHNSWALLSSADGALKSDDGESGAGAIILRMLERDGLSDHIVVVTRWYGGKHLGGDRFRHVQDCVSAYLAALRPGSSGPA